MGKRIIFPNKGEVSFETFDVQAPGAGEVCVKTLYSLMSIGTETTILHQKYDPDTHFAKMFSFPQLQTGVQTIGVVDQVGPKVENITVGELVFIRKGHASHWSVPVESCSLVPKTVDPISACWCGLAKTAFRAANAAPFQLGGEVLIIGAGPVGQMAVRWAKSAGMRQVVIADLSANRLALAGDHVSCIAGALTDRKADLLALSETEQGFAHIIDTTGNAKVFSTVLELARPFGRVILLGDTGYPSQQHLTSDMMMKGLEVIATHDHRDRNGWTQSKIDQLFFYLLDSGAFDVSGLITHTYTPDQCEQAYTFVSDDRDQALGVLFDWT